ncbi:MAG: FkbM family methyltransferase [Anaerolineae bacterium]|nr:FkbM family methyltransferase [Anaerolineae bacterium]
MKLSTLFRSEAYSEITRRYRRERQRIPDMIRNPSRWALRRALIKSVNLPVWVDAGERGRYYLKDPVDDPTLQYLLTAWADTYYPPEIGPGDAPSLILDIGAHNGMFAVGALMHWPGASLIAVEPAAEAVEFIRINVKGNRLGDRVEIVPKAIADHDGWSVLVDVPGDTCARFLQEFDPAADQRGAKIPTTTLAALLGERRPDFVKCNAEGAEYVAVPQLLALGGASTMVVQCHYRFGDPAALVEQVRTAGYQASMVQRGDDHEWWHFIRDGL